MVALERARARVIKEARPTAPRRLLTSQCRGLVLARPVEAPIDLPGHAAATVDGYALLASDLRSATPLFPIRLRAIERDPASETRRPTVRKGLARHVTAGTLLPAGADAVVPDTAARRLPDNRIEFLAPSAKDKHLRPAGSEIARGSTVLPAGHQLSAADLGLLAALGLTSVWAHPAPHIRLAYLGGERIVPGRKLSGGERYDTSQAIITAFLETRCASPGVLGDLPLDPELLVKALRGQCRALDLLVVSGGCAPEDESALHNALEWLDADIVFDQVKVQPGGACLLARVDKCIVLGLPADPLGVIAATRFLLLPLLDRFMGRPTGPLQLEQAQLSAGLRITSGEPRLVPAHAQTGKARAISVTPARAAFSGNLQALAGMNCFILLSPPHRPRKAGERVPIAWINDV